MLETNALDTHLEADASAPLANAADAPTESAQAVWCGARWVAFPYGWSRKAVEQLPLSTVPGAPAWLAGAANVDGRIVPVIDLLAWALPGQAVDAGAKDTRLLVLHSDDGLASHSQGLVAAVKAAGGTRVQDVHVATDHGWSGKRLTLEALVINWLDGLAKP